MKNTAKRNIIIGIFVTVGICLLIGIIYFIGSQQSLFGSKIKVTALFKNVSGLQSGNNVRFSGIKIGVVKQIEIASDSMVRVHFLIEEEASKFIKSDAVATIDSDGLMGNKILSVSAGSTTSQSIQENAELQSKEPLGIDDVITSIKGTSDNAKELTANLTDISQQIKNAEGLLGKVVSDTVLAERVTSMVNSFEKTSVNAATITAEVERAALQLNKGGGLITRALYDDEWSNDVDVLLDSIKTAGHNITLSTEELKKFMIKLNNNKGMINTILSDSLAANDLKIALENIAYGTEDLGETLQTIDESWLLNLFSGKEDKDKKVDKK